MTAFFNQDYYIANLVVQRNAHETQTGKVHTAASVLAEMQSQGKTPLTHFYSEGAPMGISPSALFDNGVYFANKLAQLKQAEPDAHWTLNKLVDALTSTGMTPLQHFEQYGKDEAISPTTLFNSEEYLINKTKQLYGQATAENRQATLDAITKAGMSVWDHFLQYGYKEDVDPSARFDLSRYLDDKLVQMQKTNSAYTLDNLQNDLDACGFNALTHYAAYGASEGLRPTGTYKPYEFSIDASHKGYLLNMPNVTMDMFQNVFTDPGGHVYTGIIGNSILDAEKSARPPSPASLYQDENMCWAATAANMLQWSGWNAKASDHSTVGKMTSEDLIFKAFMEDFQFGATRYGATYDAITWFGDKTYNNDANDNTVDHPKVGTGGYLHTDMTKYLAHTVTVDAKAMGTLADALGQGSSAGVRISQGEDQAHLITCWGYTVNSALAPTDPNYYTGLIVSDSDNSRFHTDPTASLNSLQYMAMTWQDNNYFSVESSPWKIDYLVTLQSNPDYFNA